MLKYLLLVSLVITLAIADDATKITSNISQNLNSTQKEHQQQSNLQISKSNSSVISENNQNSKNVNEETNNIGKGIAELVNHKESVDDDSEMNKVDDGVDFKYYWVLLVFSSLSIISIIVFKSFRLRRNRAEVKYGKPKEADEIQPLGRSKWDDDSSSENEDEIFDINFLKNTRLNPQREDV